MKKLLASALVAVSVFTAGSSVFAYGTAREPDSFYSPNIFLDTVDWFEGTIVNDVDAGVFDLDYYQWTNDTGSYQSFYVNFDTFENRNLDYMINSIGTSGVGSQAKRLSYSTGKSTWHVFLAPGGRLDVQVGSSTMRKFDPNVKYVISLGQYPWNP